MHELPNLNIRGVLVTTRRTLCSGHTPLSAMVLYHTSMGFTTKVLLPTPTFGMAGTWPGDIIAKAKRIVERVFKVIKNAVELTRPPYVCDNRRSVSSEPCSPRVSSGCHRHRETEGLYMQEILQQIAQGLGGLAMAHDTRQTALRHLEQWLTEPAFEPYRPQLTWLIAQQ